MIESRKFKEYLINNLENINEGNVNDFVDFLIDNQTFAEDLSLYEEEFLKDLEG